MFTSGKFPVHQWKVSCAVGHTFRSRSPAGAPGLATVLQTTPVWEEQRGRPERRWARSFPCRAGKGKKKRDRALPSESARRIATSAAHEFAKRVNLPNVFAKLLEMHFCPFCQFFKDAKCFLPTVGDALRYYQFTYLFHLQWLGTLSFSCDESWLLILDNSWSSSYMLPSRTVFLQLW